MEKKNGFKDLKIKNKKQPNYILLFSKNIIGITVAIDRLKEF